MEQLKKRATGSESSMCTTCSDAAKFALAILCSIGLGTTLNLEYGRQLASLAGNCDKDLNDAMGIIRAITPKDNPIYQSANFRDLMAEEILRTSESDQTPMELQIRQTTQNQLADDLNQEILDVEKTLGRTNLIWQLLMQSHADFLYHQGDYSKVVTIRRELHSIMEQSGNQDPLRTAAAKNNLASIIAELGQIEEAAVLAKDALDIFSTSLGPTHSRTVGSITFLSMVRYRQGNYEESLRLDLEAAAATEARLGPINPITCRQLHNLGGVYYRLGQYDKAEATALDAMDRMKQSLGESDPLTMATMRSLSNT